MVKKIGLDFGILQVLNIYITYSAVVNNNFNSLIN